MKLYEESKEEGIESSWNIEIKINKNTNEQVCFRTMKNEPYHK